MSFGTDRHNNSYKYKLIVTPSIDFIRLHLNRQSSTCFWHSWPQTPIDTWCIEFQEIDKYTFDLVHLLRISRHFLSIHKANMQTFSFSFKSKTTKAPPPPILLKITDRFLGWRERSAPRPCPGRAPCGSAAGRWAAPARSPSRRAARPTVAAGSATRPTGRAPRRRSPSAAASETCQRPAELFGPPWPLSRSRRALSRCRLPWCVDWPHTHTIELTRS